MSNYCTSRKYAKWSLAGADVIALYCGIPIDGRVEGSRVCYGGSISHKVITNQPYAWIDGTVRPKGSVCLVDDKDILLINGEPKEKAA